MRTIRGSYRLRMMQARVRRYLARRRALAAVARFPQVAEPRQHTLSAPLVITLTSYPPRFAQLHLTLRSLLDQTVQVNRCILWIAEQDWDQLPDAVLELRQHGLEIRKTADLKSYKKLVPALREAPDCYYVTADDDVYYPHDWVEGLIEVAREFPSDVVAYRAHLAPLAADGSFVPYRDWGLATDRLVVEEGQARLFPTGVGGILYPPGAFADGVLDEARFLELAPRGDDIWFFWMARLAGTQQRRTRRWFDIIEWPRSQEVALYATNMLGEGNDRQLRAMQDHFGPVP